MMSIADKYVIICLDCVESKTEKKQLLDLFEKTNKEVIEISINQKLNFAGNVLQVDGDKPFWQCQVQLLQVYLNIRLKK